ncbi:MAG: hypothetical protein ACYDBH_11185, partial [Acidobacteriaceae bacterium]
AAEHAAVADSPAVADSMAAEHAAVVGSTAAEHAAVADSTAVAAVTVAAVTAAAVDIDSPLANKSSELAAVCSMLTAAFFASGTECRTVLILRPAASTIPRTLIV